MNIDKIQIQNKILFVQRHTNLNKNVLVYQ